MHVDICSRERLERRPLVPGPSCYSGASHVEVKLLSPVGDRRTKMFLLKEKLIFIILNVSFLCFFPVYP